MIFKEGFKVHLYHFMRNRIIEIFPNIKCIHYLHNRFMCAIIVQAGTFSYNRRERNIYAGINLYAGNVFVYVYK